MQQFTRKTVEAIKQHKKLAFGALVALAIIIAGTIVLLGALTKDTSTNQRTNQKPAFPNYLKPAAEIKVGASRYISACQVLTLDDVSTIYGGFGDDSNISEDYYDASPQPENKYDRSIQTHCSYRGENDREVSLFTEQYMEEFKDDLVSALYPLGDESLGEKVALYKKVADSTEDQALKDFVKTLEQSAATFEQSKRDRRTGPEEKIDTDKLVVPVDRGLFTFNVIKDNVVYRLDYPVKQSSDEEYKLPYEEIAKHLKASEKAIELIKTRISNKNLDQSPAPTVLGTTDRHGESKILEACALLTSQLYQTTIGSPANRATSRTSIDRNINKARVDGTGAPLAPSNTCERSGRANDTSTSINLDMRYARSAKQIEAAMIKGYEQSTNSKLLQTSADWARLRGTDSQSNLGASFRVGPYAGSLYIINTSSAGLGSSIEQTGGTEEQYIQLINAIAEAIRSSSKQ